MYTQNIGVTTNSAGTVSSGTASTDFWIDASNPCQEVFYRNTYLTNTLTLSTNMNKVQVNYVAVFKVDRNDKNEITSAKFIKGLWIETKNGSSVDFEVAKDKDISQYNSDEIVIKTISTVTF